MEGKKPFSFTKWAKSRKGQQVIICVAFMTIPLLLLFVFTYLPFAEMVKFSFYKMKYLTPVDQRKFVGFKNYIDVFRRDDWSIKAQSLLYGRCNHSACACTLSGNYFKF